MKLSIIVPVYNEGETVAKVLDRVLAVDLLGWKREIIVVDDCSTDRTTEVLKRYALRESVRVLRHSKNRGKGAAIRTGLAKASGDYVIIQDADLEYNPSDIAPLLLVAKNNPGTAVYGSRFRGKHEDTIFGHKAANQFLTALTNLLYGSELSDMETCYKLILKEAYKRIKLTCRRFDFEPEITAKLLKKGFPILEVPIRFKKRGFSQGKKIRWYDGVSAIWTLIKNKI